MKTLTDEEVEKLCKPGEGANTCIWLLMAPKGWECCFNSKPYSLVKRWEQGLTSAKRDGCDEMRRLGNEEQ